MNKIKVTYTSTNEKSIQDTIKNLIKIHEDKANKETKETAKR